MYETASVGKDALLAIPEPLRASIEAEIDRLHSRHPGLLTIRLTSLDDGTWTSAIARFENNGGHDTQQGRDDAGYGIIEAKFWPECDSAICIVSRTVVERHVRIDPAIDSPC